MFWRVLLWQTGIFGAESIGNKWIKKDYYMMGNRRYYIY
jgi:hypothetical protein